MIFKQVRVKGQNSKLHRTWRSEDKCYRITWRREFMGVAMLPRYHACVRTHLPTGADLWDFADRHGPYKTFKAASEGCEHHRRLWSAIIQATGVRRIQELCGKIPFGYPMWVCKELSSKIRNILDKTCAAEIESDQCDPTEISENSDSEDSTPGKQSDGSLKTLENGPVSGATDMDGTTTQQTRRMSSKVTNTAIDSAAHTVTEQAAGRKKQSSTHTKRKSVGSTKKRKPTTRSSKPTKSRSKN